jgi:hypothetical protein
MKHSREKLVYNRDQEHHLRKKERKKEWPKSPSSNTNQPTQKKKEKDIIP